MTTVRNRLEAGRRRSLADLGALRALARGPVAAGPASDVELMLGRVLRALEDAEETLHAAIPPPAGGRSGIRLLAVRRNRLAGLAEDIVAARRRGDVPATRQGLYRFHALATTSWALHTDVYARLAGITAPALQTSAS